MQENLGWLEEQAKEALTKAGQPINSGSLMFQMLEEAGKFGDEANFSLDELKALYVDMSMDTIYHHQATLENPGTPQDLKDKINLPEKDLLKALKEGLGVDIEKKEDGTFTVKYEKTSLESIVEYIKKLNLPEP